MTEIGLSLREMLKIKVFQNTKVIGGEKGLDRIVSNINIMEVPDITDWVKPKELLVTTAFAIHNDIEAQKKLIPALVERDLVGLAIKSKRYLKKIPDIMIEQAENYNFPLLELSSEIIFSDLINEVLRAIVNKQTGYLNSSLNAHRLFMDIVLNGGSLPEMADSLAQLIENTVIIHDSRHEQIAYKTVNCEDECINLLYKNKELFTPSPNSLLDRNAVFVNNRKLNGIFVPIVSGNDHYGKVIVIDTNREITSSDIQITEKMAMVAAVQIINQHALIQLERRYANEFLDLLLFSNIDTEDDFINRGKFIGWDLNKPYTAIILKYLDKTPLKSDFEKEERRIEINNRIFNKISELYRREGKGYILGTKSDTLVLLLENDNNDERILYKELLNKTQKLREALQFILRDGILTISIGRYYHGVKGIQKSYKEALKALQIGERIGYEGRDLHFHQLGVFRLLSLIEKKDDIEDFLNETINPLIQYDKEKKSDFVKTLEMYFKYQGNVKKVSEKLFTHYNTILYRLERIKEITKSDFDDYEERFKLALALKIYKMTNK